MLYFSGIWLWIIFNSENDFLLVLILNKILKLIKFCMNFGEYFLKTEHYTTQLIVYDTDY